jgi:hypothetical protein
MRSWTTSERDQASGRTCDGFIPNIAEQHMAACRSTLPPTHVCISSLVNLYQILRQNITQQGMSIIKTDYTQDTISIFFFF